MSIVDYSEKAVVMVGDTIKVKDNLKELGGRYNKFLSCGAGWVFSKKHFAETDVKTKVLNIILADGTKVVIK